MNLIFSFLDSVKTDLLPFVLALRIPTPTNFQSKHKSKCKHCGKWKNIHLSTCFSGCFRQDHMYLYNNNYYWYFACESAFYFNLTGHNKILFSSGLQLFSCKIFFNPYSAWYHIGTKQKYCAFTASDNLKGKGFNLNWLNSLKVYTECKYGGPPGRRPGRVTWKRG